MTKKEKIGKGKLIAAGVLAVVALIIIILTVRFIHHRMVYAVTDAVFVRTDSLVDIGFNRVNGRLLSLNKKAGDRVEKGEVLAAIDDTIYRLAVEQYKASIEAVRIKQQAQTIMLERMTKETDLNEKIANSQVLELTKRKDALNTKIAGVEVEIEQLDRDNERYEKLLQSKSISDIQAEDFGTRLRARRIAKQVLVKQIVTLDASIETAQRQVELAQVAKIRLKEVEKNIEGLNVKIRELEISLSQAQDNLAQCEIKSPLTGRVARRYVSPGALVSPQKVILTLINPEDIYLIVLMEEQKLAGVVPGSPAQITIDAYPEDKYEGVVDTVLPASAATFALAPRDISAGEFTKVSQRIPVRIRITGGDKQRLRVGMGGDVEIKREEGKNSGKENRS